MKTLLLFLAFIALPSLVFGQDWHRSFESARRDSARSGKHMLIYFHTASCGRCKQLEREALYTRSFDKYASDKLILLDADLTRGRGRHSRYYEQNQRLADRFGVNGTPHMVILRPNGSHAGNVWYRGGGADKVKSDIDKLRNKKQKKDDKRRWEEQKRRHHHHYRR